MKIWKTIGLEYYVAAKTKDVAVLIFIQNRIGVTIKDIRLVSKAEYSILPNLLNQKDYDNYQLKLQNSKNEKPKTLVDFELADQTFNTMLNYFKYNMGAMKSDIANLELFWNKLSKSSSFAHKAHKELKKINS